MKLIERVEKIGNYRCKIEIIESI